MNETEKKDGKLVEKLESVGQMILGEIETIGGILTGDPVSQAEGQLAEAAGEVHFETAEQLAEAEKLKEES